MGERDGSEVDVGEIMRSLGRLEQAADSTEKAIVQLRADLADERAAAARQIDTLYKHGCAARREHERVVGEIKEALDKQKAPGAGAALIGGSTATGAMILLWIVYGLLVHLRVIPPLPGAPLPAALPSAAISLPTQHVAVASAARY